MKYDIVGFDKYLSELVEKGKYPGVSVTIRGPEGIIFDKGYGKRSIARDLDVDTDTMFGVASMSKSMAALACCILHVEGKMSIFDPVNKYFPDFKVPGVPDECVTVDMLMQHRACIPPMEPLEWSIAMNSIERDSLWYRTMRETSPNQMDKIEQIVEYISKGDYVPLGMPGEYMSYSNEGYALLSYIVDMASGTTLEEFLKERVFRPLGMTRSVLDLDCSEAREMSGGNITSLFEMEDGQIVEDDNWSVLPPFRGCACVKSTSRDMSAYYKCLADKGKWQGEQVIPEAAVELMIGDRFPVSKEPYYCCGLEKRQIKDIVVYEHSGGLHGVSSHGGFTSNGYSMTVLCNAGSFDMDNFIWGCYSFVNGWDYRKPLRWAEPAGTEFSMPEALCGDFLVKEGLPVHTIVRYEDGKLKAKYGETDVDLLHCGGTVFAAVRDGDPTRRVSTFKFFIREGKAWAVRCYTRFYQRVEE
ncbi:MAG: serine hydrolase [Eubacteriaceae bacterium]|nr:serine hydrolase [Eubacteriaceae bacterium]